MDVIVLGGGVAGLTAAYHLKQKGSSFLLLEKSDRFGGALHSLRQNGYLLEKGPNNFLESHETIQQHIAALNLGREVLRASTVAKNRYILSKKKLHPFPKTPLEFFKTPLLTAGGKLRLLLEPWCKIPPKEAEETISQFVTRRLGAQALRLVEPMIHGIYAGDCNRLSIQAIAPRITSWEREYGSLFKALKKARLLSKGNTPCSFSHGMETLARALYKTVQSHCRNRCEKLKLTKLQNRWRVQWEQQGNTFEEITDCLLLCIPAYEAAPLLESMDPPLSSMLSEINYVPLVLLHLMLERSSISHPLNGFGFLAGSEEAPFLLGSLWSSSIFESHCADPSKVLFTCFVGGAKNRNVLDLSEGELVSGVLAALYPLFGKSMKMVDVVVTKIRKALPQYTLGHLQKIKAIRKCLETYGNLFLAGNYLDGISVNDTMKNAWQQTEAIISLPPPN